MIVKGSPDVLIEEVADQGKLNGIVTTLFQREMAEYLPITS